MPQTWVLSKGELSVTVTFLEREFVGQLTEDAKQDIARRAGFAEPLGCGCTGIECLTYHSN